MYFAAASNIAITSFDYVHMILWNVQSNLVMQFIIIKNNNNKNIVLEIFQLFFLVCPAGWKPGGKTVSTKTIAHRRTNQEAILESAMK